MSARGRVARGDEGTSLVMVLLIVLVLSLVSTAFLSKSSTTFRAGATLQTKVTLQYGADAGLEKGIDVLQDELTSSTRTKCLTPLDDDPTEVASFTWSSQNHTVTASCRTLQGYAAGSGSSLYGAAVITTGASATLTSQGGGPAIEVDGSIYVAAPITPGPSGDLKKSISLSDGDLAVAGCTGAVSVPAVTVVSPYRKYCTTLTPAQVATSYALPSAVPALAPAAVNVNANCRVFRPGRYNAAPALLGGNNRSNYFASGLYYFAGVGAFSIGNNQTVVAGRATSGSDETVSGVNACSTDAVAAALPGTIAGSISGVGATFVMGGSSRITFGSNSTLVVNRRTPSSGPQIPMSVYGVRSGDAGWATWSGGGNAIVDVGSATPQMIFNGAINAYDSPVQLFASNPTVAAVRAGVVARSLDLKSSASATGLAVSGFGSSPSAGSRIVRITSEARGVSGDEGQSDGVAIVEFFNDGSTPRVLSWRFD